MGLKLEWATTFEENGGVWAAVGTEGEGCVLEAVQVAASLPPRLQPPAPLSVRMVVHALQETFAYASLSGPGRRVRCPSVIHHV